MQGWGLQLWCRLKYMPLLLLTQMNAKTLMCTTQHSSRVPADVLRASRFSWVLCMALQGMQLQNSSSKHSSMQQKRYMCLCHSASLANCTKLIQQQHQQPLLKLSCLWYSIQCKPFLHHDLWSQLLAGPAETHHPI